MTVADLRRLEKANPQIPQTIHRWTAANYDQFVETLYTEIDTIVKDLEDDANLSQHYTENNYNSDICRQLKRLGYEAVHDKNQRGHADITVNFARYSWIGEGKKVQSVNNSHLIDGYGQLIDRYVTGKANANHAGLLVYILGKDAMHVMSSWRTHLTEKDLSDNGYAANIAPCSENPDHVFWSECTRHTSSGSTLKIRHIGLSLHWNP
ncbi:hypothetical protein ACO0LL_14335 [Undibacterium sp. TC4M20W]|uniref:hypothetical protein n=1 Tax=Undibacterium sp. TC4M20W TaxID=3413052 RepID=UPI003BF2048E